MAPKPCGKKEMKQINLSSFPEDPALCPIRTLKSYLAETESLRPPKESKLFIGITKPHNHVTASTISRWIKSTLEMAGINTNQFKAHSTRSACTSTAASAGIPIDTILQVADWKSANTLRKFYLREQPQQVQPNAIAHAKTFTAAVLHY